MKGRVDKINNCLPEMIVATLPGTEYIIHFIIFVIELSSVLQEQ